MSYTAGTAYVHIGAPKTGTTTIQKFLFTNADRLLARGCLSPRAVGAKNQTRLALYASGRNPRPGTDDPRPERMEEIRREIADSLIEEVARKSPSRLVFTNEHLFSRLRTTFEVERVASLMREVADEVTIIVYLREPFSFLLSHYSTAVRGGTAIELDTYVRRALATENSMVHYDRILERWSSVFGSSRVRVRPYEPSEFDRGNVVRDFVSQIDMDWSDDFELPTDRNSKLSAEGLELLRRVNERTDVGGGPMASTERQRLVRLVEETPSSSVARIPAELVEACRTEVDRIVANVSDAHFDSQPLFSPAEPVATPSGRSAQDDFDYVARLVAVETRFVLVEQAERDIWRGLYLTATDRIGAAEKVFAEAHDRLERSLVDEETAVARGPSHTLVELGAMSLRAGGQDRALFAEMARVLMADGQVTEALELLDGVIATLTGLVPLWPAYAQALALSGRTERAREVLTDAIAVNPNNKVLHRALAQLESDA